MNEQEEMSGSSEVYRECMRESIKYCLLLLLFFFLQICVHFHYSLFSFIMMRMQSICDDS